MIYVLWHKVPDTDAITSAMVYAHLLNARGQSATPIALGQWNNETAFVLKQVWLPHPEIITTLPDGSTIALVDHNESWQSLDDRHQHTVISVVDHHKLGDLTSSSPLHIRFEPLASTNSILYKMYQEHGIAIPQDIATLMLSWILSDTLHFRSPTTTDEDKEIVRQLQEIAQIANLEQFANDMFAAKSDLGDMSAYDLIKKTDFKEFTFWQLKAGITCIETTNPEYCLSRKDEIIEAINTIKATEGYDFILVCVVDILHETNTTIVAGEVEEDIIHKVFDTTTDEWLADLGNRISRKKQIVPPLEERLK